VISICAGQGHDLLGPLQQHPRRDDVLARLVELDVQNVGIARGVAREAALSRVEIVTGDASVSDAYAGMVCISGQNEQSFRSEPYSDFG